MRGAGLADRRKSGGECARLVGGRACRGEGCIARDDSHVARCTAEPGARGGSGGANLGERVGVLHQGEADQQATPGGPGQWDLCEEWDEWGRARRLPYFMPVRRA